MKINKHLLANIRIFKWARTKGFLLSFLGIVIIAVFYTFGTAKWAWKSVFIGRPAFIPVQISNQVNRLELNATIGGIPFFLARSPAAAAYWWKYHSIGNGKDIADCDVNGGSALELIDTEYPDSDNANGVCRRHIQVRCSTDKNGADQTLIIENKDISFSYIPKGVKPEDISSASNIPEECQTVAWPQYRNLFLLTNVEAKPDKQGSIVVVPQAIYWRKVAWSSYQEEPIKQSAAVSQTTTVEAKQCVPHFFFNATNSPECQFVREILVKPSVVNERDPQYSLTEKVKKGATYLVPIILYCVLWLDTFLFCFVLGAGLMYLIVNKKPNNPTVNNGDAELGHVNEERRELRQFLEWLEVIGPAIGFWLTVGSLLLAFEPGTFADQDKIAFASGISMAMTATFAGLLMRILAFTGDRLVLQILYLYHGADKEGFFPKPKKLVMEPSGDTPKAGEEKGTGQ
ncbi:MAG: MotA/TolQ/ExbB proton channel family protein [Myxococcales bacterium]|nr:MotA/TolQ/ExbB proton channel family protein [Myxococcales bacterium]